jgi:hypothetical protein
MSLLRADKNSFGSGPIHQESISSMERMGSAALCQIGSRKLCGGIGEARGRFLNGYICAH